MKRRSWIDQEPYYDQSTCVIASEMGLRGSDKRHIFIDSFEGVDSVNKRDIAFYLVNKQTETTT